MWAKNYGVLVFFLMGFTAKHSFASSKKTTFYVAVMPQFAPKFSQLSYDDLHQKALKELKATAQEKDQFEIPMSLSNHDLGCPVCTADQSFIHQLQAQGALLAAPLGSYKYFETTKIKEINMKEAIVVLPFTLSTRWHAKQKIFIGPRLKKVDYVKDLGLSEEATVKEMYKAIVKYGKLSFKNVKMYYAESVSCGRLKYIRKEITGADQEKSLDKYFEDEDENYSYLEGDLDNAEDALFLQGVLEFEKPFNVIHEDLPFTKKNLQPSKANVTPSHGCLVKPGNRKTQKRKQGSSLQVTFDNEVVQIKTYAKEKYNRTAVIEDRKDEEGDDPDNEELLSMLADLSGMPDPRRDMAPNVVPADKLKQETKRENRLANSSKGVVAKDEERDKDKEKIFDTIYAFSGMPDPRRDMAPNVVPADKPKQEAKRENRLADSPKRVVAKDEERDKDAGQPASSVPAENLIEANAKQSADVIGFTILVSVCIGLSLYVLYKVSRNTKSYGMRKKVTNGKHCKRGARSRQ
ncbi:MAG: hypothetical protein AAF380_02530 [Bacteroidota bacterium]